MNKPSRMQAEAIAHIRGPALLIAGPGSGKTFVIIQRILSLVSKEHVRPDRIMVLTFSKAAANEMKTRYENSNGTPGVYFGTFHAASYGILRKYMGYTNAKIITFEQKKKALKMITGNHAVEDEPDQDLINDILGLITRIKCSDKDVPYRIDHRNINEDTLKQIISEYNSFLRDERLIDFDDMITDCVNSLREDDKIRAMIKASFDHIIIDEFQDINEYQYRFIRLIENIDMNIMAVGDDDQAIYAFRGSDPGFMKRFIEDHINTKIFYLSENHRSRERIVKASSTIIQQNHDRLNKSFKAVRSDGTVRLIRTQTRMEEEDVIVDILKKTGCSGGENEDTAIILRTNAEVLIYDSMLRKRGIETRNRSPKGPSIDGSFIYDDLRAFLNFVKNGHRRSDFIRFMNKPLRYIHRDCLLEETVSIDMMMKYYSNNREMQKTVEELWKWIELSKKIDVRGAIGIFRKSMKYDEYIHFMSKTAKEYEKNLIMADRITERLCDQSRLKDDFVITGGFSESDAANENGEYTAPQKESHGIYIMTMHMAKGLEFDNVIIPDLNEGIMPKKNLSEKAMEEERRLLYVAMTRAKESLYLLCTEERNRGISSFLKCLKADQIISSNSHSSRNS